METKINASSHKQQASSDPLQEQHRKEYTDAFRPPPMHQKVISGIRKELVEIKIWWTIVRLAFRNISNPFKVFRLLNDMAKLRRALLGENRIQKIAKVDGRYYWDLYTPGFASAAFNKYFEAEINRMSPLGVPANRFSNIILAITKKCPMKCDHCFEWDVLNQKEKLSVEDLKIIVAQFQAKGIAQIQLSGGEPMLRVDDMIEMIQTAQPATEFWILTSGYNLTLENARKLKTAGLTGVMISLDHFDPEMHNAFRGFKTSYVWVEKAVKNAIASHLVTTLSICVTRSFVTEENLMAYAELAKQLGVAFIQVLEPRAVGHYHGQDVALQAVHEKILDAFYLKMSYDPRYREYPIICYHGYYQRQIGCFASGNRMLYIDTDGDIHACPFCRTKMGSALSPDVDQYIEQLQTRGCHSFKTASN